MFLEPKETSQTHLELLSVPVATPTPGHVVWTPPAGPRGSFLHAMLGGGFDGTREEKKAAGLWPWGFLPSAHCDCLGRQPRGYQGHTGNMGWSWYLNQIHVSLQKWHGKGSL